MQIDETPAPQGSLIAAYAEREAYYIDCFSTPCPEGATLAALIEAFYTQPLFQAERLVLRVAARAPSSDAEARALAQGTSDRFAIWRVEARTDTEILMDQSPGRTKSWLYVGERMCFGSVVEPVRDRRGRLTLGPVFDTLLGPHRIYSRALLAGAKRRLERAQIK